MSELTLVQGSAEWLQARVGSLGASRIADAVAKTKFGWGASRANIMAELVAERLTGRPAETYVNDAMRRGTEKEPQARACYELFHDVTVEQVGLVRHARIPGTHASPDGLIGHDGALEIKCPNTATHLDTLLSETLADKYIKQIQWQLCCTGRAWCDFVSFDDRLPERMQMFVKRIPRDDVLIAQLEKDVADFVAELDAKVAALRNKFELKGAA